MTTPKAAVPLWARVVQWAISKPAVADWIIRYALTCPDPVGHIYADEAKTDLFMARYLLVPGGPAQASGRIRRNLWRVLPFAVRAHNMVRPDSDEEKHDHPTDFRTFVLRDWYDEEDIFGDVRRINQGDTYFSRAERFHRVCGVSPNGAWTLFVFWHKRNSWGFLVNGGYKVRWNTWEEYKRVRAAFLGGRHE